MKVEPLHPDVLDLLEVARSVASPRLEARVRRHCRLCETCAEDLIVMIRLRQGMGLPTPERGAAPALATARGTH